MIINLCWTLPRYVSDCFETKQVQQEKCYFCRLRTVILLQQSGIEAGLAAAQRVADEAHNGLVEVFSAVHRYEDAVDELNKITPGSQEYSEAFSHLDELAASLKSQGGECYKQHVRVICRCIFGD